ncbi:MAG: hypothetical protein DWI09_00690 [Planctomycetota bacterium]|nr:MAG: hypothetical protein DWI09_00690 [Planctomycetota bacterium]
MAIVPFAFGYRATRASKRRWLLDQEGMWFVPARSSGPSSNGRGGARMARGIRDHEVEVRESFPIP